MTKESNLDGNYMLCLKNILERIRCSFTLMILFPKEELYLFIDLIQMITNKLFLQNFLQSFYIWCRHKAFGNQFVASQLVFDLAKKEALKQCLIFDRMVFTSMRKSMRERLFVGWRMFGWNFSIMFNQPIFEDFEHIFFQVHFLDWNLHLLVIIKKIKHYYFLSWLWQGNSRDIAVLFCSSLTKYLNCIAQQKVIHWIGTFVDA